MNKYSFEKLEVWKKSKSFTVSIYQVTAEFPKAEKFGLVSQIRRASVSIGSNIAEGSSRMSGADQGRFYNMAYSSAVEVLNQLIICRDLDLLDDQNYRELRGEIEQITSMINRLHKATSG